MSTAITAVQVNSSSGSSRPTCPLFIMLQPFEQPADPVLVEVSRIVKVRAWDANVDNSNKYPARRPTVVVMSGGYKNVWVTDSVKDVATMLMGAGLLITQPKEAQ